jgi:hypothetical protein
MGFAPYSSMLTLSNYRYYRAFYSHPWGLAANYEGIHHSKFLVTLNPSSLRVLPNINASLGRSHRGQINIDYPFDGVH